MAHVIQCPNRYIMSDDDRRISLSIFIGGGITGTGNWQVQATKYLQERLTGRDDVFLINPRREHFDILDPKASDFQITWEHEHLKNCHAMMFWFTPETMCPITLYELGKWSMTDKPLFVGVDPNYKRKFDVIKQTSLVRPDVKVHTHLSCVLDDIHDYVRSSAKRVMYFAADEHLDQAIKSCSHLPNSTDMLNLLQTTRARHDTGWLVTFDHDLVNSWVQHQLLMMSEYTIDTKHQTIIKTRYDKTYTMLYEHFAYNHRAETLLCRDRI